MGEGFNGHWSHDRLEEGGGGGGGGGGWLGRGIEGGGVGLGPPTLGLLGLSSLGPLGPLVLGPLGLSNTRLVG